MVKEKKLHTTGGEDSEGGIQAWKTQRISAAKAVEFRRIAEMMDYKPNLSTRTMRTGQTYAIGILSFSYLSHYPLYKYSGLIANSLKSRGYHGVLIQTERKTGNIKKYLAELENHHLDGVIFLNYVPDAHKIYLGLWQNNMPMIFRVLDPLYSTIPFDHVTINHYGAALQMVQHLVSSGWTDIHLLLEGGTTQQERRLSGFTRGWREGMFQANMPTNGEGVIFYTERNGKAKYEAVRSFIRSHEVKKGRTVFLLDGSDGASGVYAAFAAEGLSVGRDVAVCGFHVVPENEVVFPEMTVSMEPYDQIAEELVVRLISRIQGGTLSANSTQKVYDSKLLIGPSTDSSHEQ